MVCPGTPTPDFDKDIKAALNGIFACSSLALAQDENERLRRRVAGLRTGLQKIVNFDQPGCTHALMARNTLEADDAR